MAKYTAYKGTHYEYKTAIPDKKKFDGKWYNLAEIYSNYGVEQGHRRALADAKRMRGKGMKARVEAHSGYTTLYIRSIYLNQ